MLANRLKLKTNKPELLWACTKNCLSLYDGSFPCLQLGADSVLPSQHVRVLGVVISSDLSLEKHVARVSASSFHYLRQLRRIWHSLNSDSVATLIHAFMTSRVDYCNAVFSGVPKVKTNSCSMLNAVACVVTSIKCDCGLLQCLHTELHWLDVPERVEYKLTHRCINGRAPQYLAMLCSSCFSGLQATYAFCCSSSVGGTVLPPQYVQSSGFRCRWPDDVECTTDTATSSGCHYCCFWTISEDCYVLGVLTY